MGALFFRLVLFRDRERVDFSFWSTMVLPDMIRGDKEYESYKNGYRILLDKYQLRLLVRSVLRSRMTRAQ